MTETTTPGFTPGQEAIWTGTRGLFSRRVRIIAAVRSTISVGHERVLHAEPARHVVLPRVVRGES